MQISWSRRRFIGTFLGGTVVLYEKKALGEVKAADSRYERADSSWFASSAFGISTHWTAQSQPTHGPAFSFAEAVARFNVDQYVDAVAGAGAKYLIFTGTHALQMLPAPCKAIDHILPGRTTHRDLILEIAKACRKRGLSFILYYNHSCNHGDDPAWEHAVGYHAPDKQHFVNNIFAILRELGARYKDLVRGYWFDSCFSLDDSGPIDSVTTDMHGFKIPWNTWTDAAKTGSEGRLVAYNPGVHEEYLYTTHQDYEAGETNTLVNSPLAQLTPEGLQAHRWVCLDNPGWVHSCPERSLVPPRYSLERVTRYVRWAHNFHVPVTFNLDVDQKGKISPLSLQLLGGVTAAIKG